jgi:hypothetical protein
VVLATIAASAVAAAVTYAGWYRSRLKGPKTG